jgi:ribosomal protein S27E
LRFRGPIRSKNTLIRTERELTNSVPLKQTQHGQKQSKKDRMKIRCGSCRQVVKVSEPIPTSGATCPQCGAGLWESQPQALGVSQVSSSKGKVPTQSKAVNFFGYMAVMLVLSCSAVLASSLGAESGFMWPVWLLGITAAVAVGIWFQNKSRKEKQ